MSMLSAQCDELRAMAESIGLAMPQAATLMMDAADTILSLRDMAQDLQAENAKLRERITTQKQTIQAYRDESRDWREVAERAQAENAKLRKLAKDLHTLAYSVLPERKSDYITICSVESCIDYYSRTMPSIERRMRELGVEL